MSESEPDERKFWVERAGASTVAFTGPISQESVTILIRECRLLVDDGLRKKSKEDPLLQIIFDSGGGDGDQALRFVDFLRVEIQPLRRTHGRIMGCCHSAATLMHAACQVRSMTPRSSYMIHEPMWHGSAATSQYANHFQSEITRFHEAMVSLYQQITGAERKQLEQWLREELWLDAQRAKTLGFVTHIWRDDYESPATDD